MVYYLEAPYGHLMLEQMEGTQARTTARGNLFSFELPWEDVSARCKEADTAWYAAATAAKRSCALPHDEDVLATLVNVHIVGGSAEAVAELDGAAMRTEVVLALISELRESGYPDTAESSTPMQLCASAHKLFTVKMALSHSCQRKFERRCQGKGAEKKVLRNRC